jgi:hypothetical protein
MRGTQHNMGAEADGRGSESRIRVEAVFRGLWISFG